MPVKIQATKIATAAALLLLAAGCTTVETFREMSPDQRAQAVCNKQSRIVELKKEKARTKIIPEKAVKLPDSDNKNLLDMGNKSFQAIEQSIKLDVLSGVDLSNSLDKEKYKKK